VTDLSLCGARLKADISDTVWAGGEPTLLATELQLALATQLIECKIRIGQRWNAACQSSAHAARRALQKTVNN
jgi:hypothetical protein